MAEAMTRADVLRLLKRCPVCGAALSDFVAFGEGERSARARFECGAFFVTYGGEPIEVPDGCPAPSRVAAAELERERVAKCAS